MGSLLKDICQMVIHFSMDQFGMTLRQEQQNKSQIPTFCFR